MPAERLMVLGAGPEQVPLIRRAVARGVEVITTDYLPDNVGHRFSHRFVNASTVDRESVLHAADELHVDGITTVASDVAVPTVAYVAERRGLRGPSALAAETMHHKGRFRRFQWEHGFRAPRQIQAESFETVRELLPRFPGPVVVKPVDSSGSKGVGRVEPGDETGAREAFAAAKHFSRSGTVCIEELVRGFDVSGNAFLARGRPELAVLTWKRSRALVPVGHTLPAPLTPSDAARIWHEVCATCDALGYREGPLDFDARMDGAAVTVIEMSPRLGGNCIPLLIEHATGIDLLGACVDLALDRPRPSLADAEITRPCGVFIFGSERAGRLDALADPAQLREAVPEAFDAATRYAVGAPVPAFTHSGNSLGWVLFDCDDGAHYQRVVERIVRALALRVS